MVTPVGSKGTHPVAAEATVSDKPGQVLCKKQLNLKLQQALCSPNPCVAYIVELVKNGADPSMLNHQGYAAIHYICRAGDVDDLRALLMAGALVNYTDADGRTPLYIAANAGHAEQVQCLIEHGAGVNLASTFGNIPLHAAARGGHLAVCELLIHAGSDVTHCNHSGDTPLNLANVNLRNIIENQVLTRRKAITNTERSWYFGLLPKDLRHKILSFVEGNSQMDPELSKK